MNAHAYRRGCKCPRCTSHRRRRVVPVKNRRAGR